MTFLSSAVSAFKENAQSVIPKIFTVIDIRTATSSIYQYIRTTNPTKFAQVNERMQELYLATTIAKIYANYHNHPPILREVLEKCSTAFNNIRDITDKLKENGTLDPRILGVRGTIEVVGDIINVVLVVPQDILKMASPTLESKLSDIAKPIKNIRYVFIAYDVAKKSYDLFTLISKRMNKKNDLHELKA